jgi:hypothetical protein
MPRQLQSHSPRSETRFARRIDQKDNDGINERGEKGGTMSILSDTFENASELTRCRWFSISRNRVPSSVSMNREIAS